VQLQRRPRRPVFAPRTRPALGQMRAVAAASALQNNLLAGRIGCVRIAPRSPASRAACVGHARTVSFAGSAFAFAMRRSSSSRIPPKDDPIPVGELLAV